MENQQSLFANGPPVQIVNCTRCGIRCQAVDKRNQKAQVFVKGDVLTGRFCVNCLVVDFFKNFELGPVIDDKFDPECLRLPHIQQQFAAIVVAAKSSYGAELTSGEIDWDEVIANWNLPFRDKPKRGRKK
jgi:hypothetical protein